MSRGLSIDRWAFARIGGFADDFKVGSLLTGLETKQLVLVGHGQVKALFQGGLALQSGHFRGQGREVGATGSGVSEKRSIRLSEIVQLPLQSAQSWFLNRE
jgi:hypothetical protein